MPNIRIDVLPWLSHALRPGISGHLRFEVQVAGQTLRDLLSQLAARDEAFARLVYDAAADAIRFPVRIAINDELAELCGGLDAKLDDGDTVTLMAAYTGGARGGAKI